MIGEFFFSMSSWNLRKINATCILHLLTDEQKRSQVLNAKTLLKCFVIITKKFLNNLVNGD